MSTYEDFIKDPKQKLLLDAELNKLLFEEATQRLIALNNIATKCFTEPSEENKQAFISEMSIGMCVPFEDFKPIDSPEHKAVVEEMFKLMHEIDGPESDPEFEAKTIAILEQTYWKIEEPSKEEFHPEDVELSMLLFDAKTSLIIEEPIDDDKDFVIKEYEGNYL